MTTPPTLKYLIDNLGWANLANESQVIFRRISEAITTFLMDAPIDGSTYGRKDGAWEEIVSTPGTASYKVYTALISQTGTNDPTLVVLENTLGQTVTVHRNNTGRYELNISGNILLLAKTWWTITDDNNNNWFFWMNKENSFGNTNTMYIDTGSASPVTYTDGILQSTPIEIRVYN